MYAQLIKEASSNKDRSLLKGIMGRKNSYGSSKKIN
jgi:hypothetical protein